MKAFKSWVQPIIQSDVLINETASKTELNELENTRRRLVRVMFQKKLFQSRKNIITQYNCSRYRTYRSVYNIRSYPDTTWWSNKNLDKLANSQT